MDEEPYNPKARQSKSPSQFIKGVVNQIGDKLAKRSPTREATEKTSVHNVKSSELIVAAMSLKKTLRSDRELQKIITRMKQKQKQIKMGGKLDLCLV